MKKRKLIFTLLKLFLIIGIPLLLYLFLPIARSTGGEQVVNAKKDRDYIAILSIAIVLLISYKVLYNLYIKDFRQTLLVRVAANPTPNNLKCTIDKTILHTLNAIVPAILVFVLIILSAKLGAALEGVPGTIELPMGLSWTRPAAGSIIDRSTAALTQIHRIVFYSAIAWLIAFGLGILDYVLDYRDFRRKKK